MEGGRNIGDLDGGDSLSGGMPKHLNCHRMAKPHLLNNLCVVFMKWVEKTRCIVEREGIEAELFEHKEWGKDSRVVSAFLNVPLANVVKGLVCFSREGPLLVVVCGDERLDLDKLGRLTDVSVRLGRAKEVEGLGFEVGGVPAIGSGLRIFVDRKVLARSFIVGSAGSPYVGIRLKPSDLVRLNNATVADLSEEEES